ncbi:hypothetical protein Desdi_0225 [Desulfitobacterium dichloroeliminans LMG P-21439]|uniref:Adenylate cyclase n=1 Tax=Desulfitobacterium dichloroeliminans (strain LMG P-21439 / DCA1) TaxID=871963 RepID=L0F3Y4_DESDL|nr:hypothetical protein [Desulfitobacterium dichloroeliminans]AGA67775.1 hypothetical protein Desdi_0225 [Desulfitobacterium dichloroeliminans LMG P-21439]
MSFTIKSKNDVFKFALPLHDYLSLHGKLEEAEVLASLVDSCYPEDAQALEAHRRAFKQIRETIKDFPSEYQHALDDALRVLSE